MPSPHQGEPGSRFLALHRLGRHEEAITHYRRAIELWRQLGNQFYEAGTLTRLGAAYRHQGDLLMTQQSWGLAAQILTGLNHHDAALVGAELAKLHENQA